MSTVIKYFTTKDDKQLILILPLYVICYLLNICYLKYFLGKILGTEIKTSVITGLVTKTYTGLVTKYLVLIMC